ncbi:MAG: CoA-binding protein [Desulfurococcales archaeon]|nr:CoA-binding protein [Desulfurococcales archaeon]
MNPRIITDPLEAAGVLKRVNVVAVVGASGTPGKDAYRVPLYLVEHGLEVIPVNPRYEELYGKKSYPSLFAIPRDFRSMIDVVDIFRPASEALNIVMEANSIRVNGKPWVIWFQWDTDTNEAVRYAVDRGFIVVRGLCIKRVHSSMHS